MMEITYLDSNTKVSWPMSILSLSQSHKETNNFSYSDKEKEDGIYVSLTIRFPTITFSLCIF